MAPSSETTGTVDGRFLGRGSSRGSREALAKLLRRWEKALGFAPLTAADSPFFLLRSLRSRRFLRRAESSLLVDEPEMLAAS